MSFRDRLWLWWHIELDTSDRLGCSFLGLCLVVMAWGIFYMTVPPEIARKVYVVTSVISLVFSLWAAWEQRQKNLGKRK